MVKIWLIFSLAISQIVFAIVRETTTVGLIFSYKIRLYHHYLKYSVFFFHRLLCTLLRDSR